ncbi:Histidine kinase-, DNA gyrase B-, and HSP90-like ATPase [Paenibacillus sp. UNC496MF]|uniref:sensor histidine kinase n=1 Tax=Paenibacillus sp. UNC496MF TaxID=1502753 RepID=UPI0008E01FA3|nr:histidine kinase [Paenibacillus sp. UNC496MF]SFJ81013.1 Histidine kinase-, DNA gyrase B-, and HSP90-like ATPase [Paenibacillus sp. UNC496MF]
MARHTERKLHPIQHYVRIILIISFSALILDFIISFASIAIVKQQSARDLRDTSYLYINRINADFAYINHFMGWTLANDENVKVMNAHAPDEPEFRKANKTLYRRFVEVQKGYGEQYNFFLYFDKKDYLQNCAPMGMTYKEYQALQKQVGLYIKDKVYYEKLYSWWSTVQLAGKSFILNIVPYHDGYLICLISADDLIRPLRETNLGENGYASLISEDGSRVTSPISNKGKLLDPSPARAALLDLVQPKTTVNGAFTNASFYVQLVIQFGAFEKIMIAQLLIVLLAVIIAASLCFILLYFKHKVLQPIKSFSYNLAFWTGDGEPIDVQSSKMAELEKANRQFRNLVKQIKAYKIDIYERELEKQRIQLDYMKLQIKPHFFLNCLTTIHSMAQMGMDEEIQQMALSTSAYFRYIFREGRDFVRLADELEHVRIYLEIQRSRYRDSFVYRISLAEDARDARIPPLVLQTFVENAVKYAVSREHDTAITIEVERRGREEAEGGGVTVIRIADTGPGFAPDVLAKLRRGEPLDQSGGTRIGIMNTVQRLAQLYGEGASVRFGGADGGGALVVLALPEPPEAADTATTGTAKGTGAARTTTETANGAIGTGNSSGKGA